MKNKKSIAELLRTHLTPDSESQSGGTEAEIDFNLLARYADGTATPEDQERIAVLQATNSAFAELVEAPGTLRSDQVRVIPIRRRWLPMALRYAACFVAVLIGSAYLYQRFSPDVRTQKPFITQKTPNDVIKLNTPLGKKGYAEKATVVAHDTSAGTAGGSGLAAKESSVKYDISRDNMEDVVLTEAETVVADSTVMDDLIDYDLADKERLAGTGEERGMQTAERSKGLRSSISKAEQEEPSYGSSLVRKDESADAISRRTVVTTKSVVAPVAETMDAKTKTTPVASSISESKTVVAGAVKKKTELAEIRAESKLQADNTCALFIGIDTYKPEQAGVASLKNAVVDMNNVQVAMNDFPFAEVVTLSNEKATRSNIDSSIRKLRSKAGTNGSLLIYYNGQAVQYAEQPDQQFLVPVDGSVNRAELSDNNISVETLNNDAAAAPIVNTYVVLDCEFQPVAGDNTQADQYKRKPEMDELAAVTTNTVKEETVTLAARAATQPVSDQRQARRKAVKERSEILLSNQAQLSSYYVQKDKEITGEGIANFVASNESVRIQQAPVQQMLRRYRQVEQKGRNYIFYRAEHTDPSGKE